MTLDSLCPLVATADVCMVTHFLILLLLAAITGAVLVSVFAFLCVICPPHLRRRPVFMLNLLACVVGICEAVLCSVLMVLSIMGPVGTIRRSLILVSLIFALFPAVFVDSILFFRMLAFYPTMLTTRRKLFTIVAFPALCKLARLGTLTASITIYYHSTAGLSHLNMLTHSTWFEKPVFCISLILQMADNSYVCFIFLYKLNRFKRMAQVIGADNVLRRIPAILVVALGNHVFPVAMNIVQIVLLMTGPSFMSIMEIFVTSNFVTILGVVFATVWTNTEFGHANLTGPRSNQSYMQEQEERVVPGLPVHMMPRSSSTFVVDVGAEAEDPSVGTL